MGPQDSQEYRVKLLGIVFFLGLCYGWMIHRSVVEADSEAAQAAEEG